METRINYAAVGIFVVTLTVAFVGGVLLLSAGLGGAQYDEYVAYVDESVSGLNLSAPVKYKGVDVGFVREIGLRPNNPEQVRIAMDIERGTPVKTDTIAVLSVQGLTGLAFIDLTGGTAEAPMLQVLPGDEYRIIRTGPSLLARLDAAASTMFTNIERISDAITNLIDDDSQEAFRETLSNLRTFTEQLNTLLDDENVARLDQSIEGLHELTTMLSSNADALETMLQDIGTASAKLPDTMDALGRTAGSLERMGDSLSVAGDQFTATMSATQTELQHVAQQLTPDAVAVLADLRAVSTSLERFVADLERDPAILIYGRRRAARGPGE